MYTEYIVNIMKVFKWFGVPSNPKKYPVLEMKIDINQEERNCRDFYVVNIVRLSFKDVTNI